MHELNRAWLTVDNRDFLKLFAVASLAILVSGCAGVPTYEPKAGTANAQIRMPAAGFKWICVDHVKQVLGSANGKIDARVPVGGRITVGFVYSEYIAVTSQTLNCTPRASFEPSAGKSYIMNLAIERGLCEVRLYQEVDSGGMGKVLEPTQAKSNDCPGQWLKE